MHGRCDQRSDVYSAGIVFFELLTGHPPYRGESAMNVAYQHVHSRVPAPSSRVKGIPTPIDEIVVAATDSDPSGRPGDASAFLAELADTRAQLALPVVPVPPRARTRPPMNGHQPHHPRMGSRTTTAGPAAAADGQRPAQRPGRPGPVTGATTGRTARTVPGGTGRTDNLRTNSARHETEIVDGRPAPPPPVVIPPRRQVSARVRRRRRRFIALIAVLMLGAVSLGTGIVGVRLWREWNTHVPKLAGLSVADAEARLHTTGYAISTTITHVFDETVPSGMVVRTDPGAGERVAQGNAVGLVVSLGKDRIPVPDVSGEPQAAAAQTLTMHGLVYNTADQEVRPSVRVPAGNVISTNPAAGTSVRRNAPVTLIVSSGKPDVKVPYVQDGMPYAQAARILREHHLVASRSDDYNPTIASGLVVSVDQTGQSVRWGTTVTVHVSKGPEFVTIPDYHVLEPLSELRPQLEQLGLQVDVVAEFGGKAGRVLNVDPQPGTQVHPGDVVKVTIV